MLLIHRAERADALVSALGGLLRAPAADPFRAEVVAVPSRGVERWLAQQLSHVLGAADGDGVCANVQFPSYTSVLDEAVAEADPGYAASVDAWSAERSVWPLLRVIEECAAEPWAAVLAAHLGLDGSGDKGRRFAVAAKLAGLFARYSRSRPQLLLAWLDGRDEQGDGSPLPADLTWQAELWRRLQADIGVASPAELLDAACARIAPGPSFSIFGATRISPARVQILKALARTRDVQLWLHHPSPALWAAVQSAGEQPGRRRAQRPVVDNPLLASLSRDVRELQQLLNGAETTDVHHPIEDRPRTLLGHLQEQLASDQVSEPHPIDNSLQVHAAHGPARQVEIIREAILGLLAADPTLEPRDIVIMCPDVESFAPLVAASFGIADEPGGHPAAKLRVKLADRSLRQTNPLLSLLAQLLELAASRVTATQLLDLAGAAPVRRRFGFDDDDLERLRDWTVAAGARWGLDAAHRAGYGLANIGQGTWRSALDRVLLGVAMEEGDRDVGGTLPLDDVDSADIDLAGRFAELVNRVDHAVRELNTPRAVPEWARLLTQLVQDIGAAALPWQEMQLRRELDEVAASAADATDADIQLGLADLTALLRARLAGRPTRANFRTGTLTVCTLVPMRSVPHRVVCLLGMDDGAFPRQGITDGDDILARDPRTGERDVRSEDRQLFLDAICAAREHLIITYTGKDPRTGADVPPCVPLQELLDVAGKDAVIHHPLQPFDARNFRPGELGTREPFSFDPAGLAGAVAAAHERRPVPPLVGTTLPAADAAEIGLDELIRFLQHPVRGFLRQRLAVATTSGDDEPDDALTVELDGLQGWAIGERVLQRCLRGTTPRHAARLEHLRGELPPGPLGNRAMREIGHRIDAIMAASAKERAAAATTCDVAVDLGDGRVLTGTLSGIRDGALLTVTYATLRPRQRLQAWVRYLALVASTEDPGCRAVTVGRKRDAACRSTFGGIPLSVAKECLKLLVQIRDAGLREPLPFAIEASAEYATRRQRGAAVADALPEACHRWEADRFSPERDEPEHLLVYGRDAPFDRLTAASPAAGEEFPDEPTRFGALARRVWGPLLIVEDMQ